MEIPGIAPLSGQPTLTNPLNQQGSLEGRTTASQAASETQNTVTASEQSSTTVSSAQVVSQAEEANESNPTADENPGSTIDITA